MKRQIPKVLLLGLGGTISYLAASRSDLFTYSETGSLTPIDDLLTSTPEVKAFAQVQAEDYFREDFKTTCFGPDNWPGLAATCTRRLSGDPRIAGVVITHGSNYLEETAYFLSLTVRSRQPVVLTAAQRPYSGLGTDARSNLLAAVRVAASPDSIGRGTLVVMNDEIHAARDVAKTNTTRLEAFGPKELGFLGYVDPDGKVAYYRRTEKQHSIDSEFTVEDGDDLPAVVIAYDYAGIGKQALAHLFNAPVDGLVVAAAGGGLAPALRATLSDLVAKTEMPIVISSRTGNGRVMARPAYQRAGFIVADNLTPQKARVLLMVALMATRDTTELRRIFASY